MRIANVGGRLVVLHEQLAVDVAAASKGLFDSDPQAVYGRWVEFVNWHASTSLPVGVAFDQSALGPPVTAPSQVFAVGLNYAAHAREAGLVSDAAEPPIFTKFPSCLAGPMATVTLPPDGHTDWEVELVAVMGRTAHCISPAEAWDHVAGLTVGQDLSERRLQVAASPPQFSLGKSYPNFGPLGPCLVTVDEFLNPDDLELGCSMNGDVMQRARSSDMILSVPELIARLSAVVTLRPGDVVFTGTPEGVGMARTPPVFLSPGDELVSYVEGIGELRQQFTAC